MVYGYASTQRDTCHPGWERANPFPSAAHGRGEAGPWVSMVREICKLPALKVPKLQSGRRQPGGTAASSFTGKDAMVPKRRIRRFTQRRP